MLFPTDRPFLLYQAFVLHGFTDPTQTCQKRITPRRGEEKYKNHMPIPQIMLYQLKVQIYKSGENWFLFITLQWYLLGLKILVQKAWTFE